MGLEVNLIKTLATTVKKCKSVANKGYREAFQLSKESPLRKRGFTTIEPCPGGDIWELRGKNSSLLFDEFDKSAEQILPSGTRILLTEDETKVIYGVGNKTVGNSLLSGFRRTKDNITFFVRDSGESITIPRNSSKSKIQEVLYRLLGKQPPKQKWSLQEFNRRICEDFSEEMVKPVHDYLEGNLTKEELVQLIRKYKKYTPLDIIPSRTEKIIGDLYGTKPIEYLKTDQLSSLSGIEFPKIESMWREDIDLRWLYEYAKDEPEYLYVLKEFFKNMGKNSIGSPLYRFIGKSEYEKLISGDIVKTRAGYNQGIRFDVTPKPDGYWGDYRIKLNIEASPETMHGKPINCQKPEENYYHWYTPQYDINDVRAIVDWKNKKIVYESDEEILSNFIEEYLSKLG